MIIGANEVFGKNLTTVIKHSGKTRAQLCKFLKTKESKIVEYENGKKSPSFDEIIGIAKFCNVSASELMNNIDCCDVKRISRDDARSSSCVSGFDAANLAGGLKNIDDIDVDLGVDFASREGLGRFGVNAGVGVGSGVGSGFVSRNEAMPKIEDSYLSSLFNAVSKISSKAVKDMILEIAESSVERVD